MTEVVNIREPEVTEESGGVGIHWSARLRRKDYDNTVVVQVDGSASGHMRTPRWYVRVYLWVPEERNRQPRPDRGIYGGVREGEEWVRRIENVSRALGTYDHKQDAIDAAYKFIRDMDREALLDDIIEEMWANEYTSACNSYLRLGTGDAKTREARIEKIRALRKSDPEFAELFAEPPNKRDY